MFRSFLSDDVVTVDQLARLSAEQIRRCGACADPIAQLLHLASHRFFGERGLVDVRSSVDVAVPLRSDLLRADFHIHHRKACGYQALEVNDRTLCSGVEQNAQA
jgi:hypothetical protein